ncbi:branched-chain amino acid ABC transporter permease [Pilimelia terevasa]|uniref:Branched-chain amino acid ABC transporter permease n=2 Tax=Pilimelia terevasa TaxID=53372 RepID=A0A8J3BLQ3_9ACTN|nr:branched-chain amino acid ABC transporter permease [Pilimelia terevasa]GGK23685.1 branched-chain amino acid ABC transporter permease [Pilimelia terevasa]
MTNGEHATPARAANGEHAAPRARGWQAMKSRWSEMPQGMRWAGTGALVVFLYLLPNRWFYEYLWYLPTQASDMATVLFETAFFVLLAVGLNVVVGFAGLLDLGYFGFFAVGAYVVALVTSPESKAIVEYNWLADPITWVAAVPIAVAIAMVSGVILGGPTLRLRGDYLAIVTLGFAEMIRLYASRTEGLLNGDRGIPDVPHPVPGVKDATGDSLFLFDAKPYYWVVLTIIIAVVVLVRNMERSRVGRAWVAIREDEDAAEIMGVNTFKYKLLAFAIGAAIGGLSGAVFAGKQGFINSASFQLESSILVLAAVILGGAGNIGGAIVGATITWYLPEWVRGMGKVFGLSFDPSEYRILAFGLVIIVMMIFRPQGIWPNKRRASEFADRRKEVAANA